MINPTILCPLCNLLMQIEHTEHNSIDYYIFYDCRSCHSRIGINSKDLHHCIDYYINFINNEKNDFVLMGSAGIKCQYRDGWCENKTNLFLFRQTHKSPLVSVPFVPIDLNNTENSFNQIANRLIKLIPFI